MFNLRRSSLLFLPLTFLFGTSALLAQTATTDNAYSSSLVEAPLPDAPSTRPQTAPTHKPKWNYEPGGYSGPFGVHVSCGGGLDLGQGQSKGNIVLCGAGFTLIPYTALEFGGVRLQDGSAHFYLSEDFIAPITPVIKRLHGEPIGILGYTKIVGNSNRLDYGLGWEHHVGPQQSVGLEVRDYLQFTNPVQHAVVFRLALVAGSDVDD